MNNTYPKEREGLCVGVLSGDRILFQGPPDRENGGYKQKILHLSGIQAPKVDPITSKDQRYGYAARQFMRKRLVGKKLKFIVEKKVNEIQIGHVIYEGRDITIQLLQQGLARLRGDKIHAQNGEMYADAQQDAKDADVGVWNEQPNQKAYRSFNKQISQFDLAQKHKGKSIPGIVEEIHPSKAIIYFPTQGVVGTLHFSEVQVVVISQKINNGQTKNNARAIRSVLESEFLQRQVNVHISNASNKQLFSGYLINEQHQDVRKILLQNGFAKLSKDAMSSIETKQFIQLKGISQKALQQGKGLWKQQKITKTQSSNDKKYSAVVQQVHSGDSISVYNPIKKSTTRLFFPHVRAASNGQPYAFEAKQSLRKKCIGKKVTVQVEFVKQIPIKKFEGDTKGELKPFVFASVIENGTNLSVYMLQQGLVKIQQIRAEEDISKYLQQMRNAEQQSKKAKKGLHSKINVKLPTFNDISGGKGKKIDASKAKEMFQFLKDQQHLSGTVQLVLNGSRFKVRFHQQHLMAIVVLDGVRCLPNEGDYTKVSEQALQYSKINAYQRDFQIKIKRVDLKGIYHGVISLNKKDYAIDLLENGLAVTVQRNKNQFYQQIEADARKKKVGLWKYDFNLTVLKGGQVEKQFKSVNFAKNLVLTEVVTPHQFYMESEGGKKPQIPQKINPANSIKIGQLYAAQFSVDGVFYRGKIVKQTKQGFEVFFIDYGNYDIVHRSKIGTLQQNQKKIKSPLFHCSLYGLDGFTKQATNIMCDYIGTKLKVQMKQQADDGQYRVVLHNKDKCINLELLQFGQADNTSNIQSWSKAEQTAQRNREGKWNDE